MLTGIPPPPVDNRVYHRVAEPWKEEFDPVPPLALPDTHRAMEQFGGIWLIVLSDVHEEAARWAHRHLIARKPGSRCFASSKPTAGTALEVRQYDQPWIPTSEYLAACGLPPSSQLGAWHFAATPPDGCSLRTFNEVALCHNEEAEWLPCSLCAEATSVGLRFPTTDDNIRIACAILSVLIDLAPTDQLQFDAATLWYSIANGQVALESADAYSHWLLRFGSEMVCRSQACQPAALVEMELLVKELEYAASFETDFDEDDCAGATVDSDLDAVVFLAASTRDTATPGEAVSLSGMHVQAIRQFLLLPIDEQRRWATDYRYAS